MIQPQSRPNLEARSAARSGLELPPDLDTVADLLRIAGHPSRLKILYLLHHRREINVTQLADALETSVSTASRHVLKLRASELVAPRPDGGATYYRLTDHPFHKPLCTALFDAAIDDLRSRDE